MRIYKAANTPNHSTSVPQSLQDAHGILVSIFVPAAKLLPMKMAGAFGESHIHISGPKGLQDTLFVLGASGVGASGVGARSPPIKFLHLEVPTNQLIPYYNPIVQAFFQRLCGMVSN